MGLTYSDDYKKLMAALAAKKKAPKQTSAQQKLHNDFQWLKAQDQIQKFGYGKKLPTKR